MNHLIVMRMNEKTNNTYQIKLILDIKLINLIIQIKAYI